MDLLPKLGIYIGIGVGLTVFTLFMIMIIPWIGNDAARQWEEAFGEKLSDEQLMEIFSATDSYKAFYERYPNAGEQFRSWEYGRGELELTAMNYTTNNMLRLEINYERDDNLSERANCDTNDDRGRVNIRGSGTAEFIEKTQCLDMPYGGLPILVPEPIDSEFQASCVETGSGVVCDFD